MKAIVCTGYGAPEVLQLQEVKTPTPRKHEIRVRVRATAVTASDCIVRAARLPAWHPMGFMMRMAIGFRAPRQPILGMVFAGEVDCVGEGVHTFQQGDQVYGWDLFPAFGAYAEYKCISATGVIAHMPSPLNHQEAAALPFGGLMALHFLQKARLQSKQHILVYGASGAIGTSAVQIARSFGANVTGVCSTSNLDLVRSLGASQVIDYTREDFTRTTHPYDVVLNAAGKSKARLQPNQLLVPGGKHITVDDGNPRCTQADLITLNALVASGHLRPVIDRTYLMEQMVEAHRYVDGGHKKGNVIVTVD